MNDDDIKRNIIASVVGLVLILPLLIFSVGSDIDFYLLLLMELGVVLFIVLLIGSLKERRKKEKLLQELDEELEEDLKEQENHED